MINYTFGEEIADKFLHKTISAVDFPMFGVIAFFKGQGVLCRCLARAALCFLVSWNMYILIKGNESSASPLKFFNSAVSGCCHGDFVVDGFFVHFYFESTFNFLKFSPWALTNKGKNF